MKHILSAMAFCAMLVISATANAQNDAFITGDVMPDYGKVAPIETDMPVAPDFAFKALFDLHDSPTDGSMNRGLTRAARLINMHGSDGGLEPTELSIAIIIHGKAVFDVSSAGQDGPNPNADLVSQLFDHGVRIVVCGQTAAYYEVAKEDLIPGVEMALSAMTAHAVLQNDGYVFIP